MEWLQDDGGIHDLCGHSNMEWLQDDVEDMISVDIRTWNDYKTMGEYMISVDIRTWNDYKMMWKTWSLDIQTHGHLNMEWLQDNVEWVSEWVIVV
jgi:hypothetical protein